MSRTENALPQVLVIDDDETIHLWAKRHLLKAGFTLISALNGSEGLNLFKEQEPDIVLVDIDMPILDGFGTCSVIRDLPNGKNTPVLVMTGTEDAERIAKSYSSGATDFVVKPINWKVLIHRLHYMVKASNVLHKLKTSESRLSKAQQMAKLGHWEWNDANNKLFWSPEIYEIFELDANQFHPTQENYLQMIHVADQLHIKEAMAKVMANSLPQALEYRIITGKNKQRFIAQQIEALTDQSNKAYGLTGTIQDITERKDHENQIRQLAYYDEITTLPNRTYFLELLTKTIDLAKRNHREFVVLFLDLDGFKGINDTYGHHVGDLVLKEIAKRLTDCLRHSDVASRFLPPEQICQSNIARLGGDEFTIILNDIKQRQDAAIVADNILQSVSEPIPLQGQLIYIGASIGVAYYPEDGSDGEALLKCADIAMYHAKKNGKGNYQFFHDSMNIKAKKRLEMETLMHQATAKNELRLYYQPIVDASSGLLIGAEALMRWESPELGFLSPNDFIPLAEENGLIIKLGEWAIREVCQQHKEWQLQGMGHLTIAVNLSSLQFNQNTFIPMVKAILAEYAVDPGFLVFELTETMIMADTEKMLSTLWQLKEIGIKLSIDDFGTGYSSLSYLKNFPLDSLKIDRSFIKDLPGNIDDGAIVNAILTLAKTLSLNTIAEGVETRQQREFFEKTSCESIQGFLFSKPMPIEEFMQYWLTEAAKKC